ncbi:hypothetical protein GW17_00010230 [Ensete ventricosum]|nr:hypothetical protein GW17_00010230 [Ensete ventricosum]
MVGPSEIVAREQNRGRVWCILRCGFDTIARSVGERHRLAYACKGEKSNATACFPRKSETERVAFWDVALFRKSTHDVSVWGPKLSLYTRRAHTPIAGDRNRDWSRATKSHDFDPESKR